MQVGRDLIPTPYELSKFISQLFTVSYMGLQNSKGYKRKQMIGVYCVLTSTVLLHSLWVQSMNHEPYKWLSNLFTVFKGIFTFVLIRRLIFQ